MSPADLRSQLESLHASSFAWAIACCGDRDEAADVLQAAYEKVLSGTARVGGKSALKTWGFGVIQRTAQESVGANINARSSIKRSLINRWMEMTRLLMSSKST